MLLYRATEFIAYPAVRSYFGAEVTGRENVPPTGAVIFAANHLSAADQVFTPVAAGRQILYFAKAEYFTQPGLRGRFVARLFREFGHVPVDRFDTQAAASTIALGAELLAGGAALGIYPEGTRSPTGQLHKFRTGVARLALRTGAPVVPVGLIGTNDVLTPGDRRWHRRPVGVHFGAPLDFSGRADDERSSPKLREVTEAIRVAVQRLSGQEYLDRYAVPMQAAAPPVRSRSNLFAERRTSRLTPELPA